MHFNQRHLMYLILLLLVFYLITGFLVILWLSGEDNLASSRSRISEKIRGDAWRNLVELPSAAGKELPVLLSDAPQFKSEADLLGKNVRLFCFILTSPNNTVSARAVKATWLTRCNGFVFISSVDNPELPSLQAPVEESWDNLWGKTKFGFRYAHNTSLNSYDWFLKADDDTYVIVENLRLLLSNYSASDPIYFGCNFKKHVKQGYMSGGAGYVLSRQALRLFIEEGLNKNRCNDADTGEEDVEAGICLETVGVKAMDSRDQFGLGRFFPFLPADQVEIRRTPLTPNMTKWWWYADFLKYQEEGVNCCSDRAISFHYATEYDLYALEYLIYHLNPGVRLLRT